MARRTNTCIPRLLDLGFNWDDAHALRRISMTLQRWFELECGNGNEYGSWAIVRGKRETRHSQHSNGHGAHYVFIHDDDGRPYIKYHHYQHGRGKDYVSYTLVPDRENGARKRLAKLMTRYPALVPYIQTDPLGAALYILRRDDIPGVSDVSSIYNRGVAVYR